MKKIICLMLALLTVISLVACGSSKKDTPEVTEEGEKDVAVPYSKEAYYEEIGAENALFGVSYLGYFDPSANELIEFLNAQQYWSKLLFLEEVNPKNICSVDFGYELYVVLPMEGVEVTVYKTILDEDGNIQKGNQLLKVEGEAFYLNGNVSDIFPDFLIVAEKGVTTVEYSPMLSGKDGRLVSGVEGVKDITPYDKMGDFIYSEAEA